MTQIEAYPPRRVRRPTGETPGRAETSTPHQPAAAYQPTAPQHPAAPYQPAAPYPPAAPAAPYQQAAGYPPAPHQPAASRPPAAPYPTAASRPPAAPYPPAPPYPPAAPYQPAGQRPATQRPTQRPATQRPATQRPATQRPTGQRPTTQRPADQRTTAPRPGYQPPNQQANQRPVFEAPAAQNFQAPPAPSYQAPAAPSYQPPVAPRQPIQRPPAQAIGLEYDRRGSHATIHGQDFSWVLLWTILGALIPGTGLIAAGWRRLGGLLLVLLGLAGSVLGFLVVSGNLQGLALSLAFDASQLFNVAVAAAAIGVIWVMVILLTNSQLRRYASLNSGQRLFSGVVVLALIGAVILPAYKISETAMITRSVVTSNNVFRGDSENGTNSGPSAVTADPWAKKPQMNVLLIGSDAGSNREGIRPDTLILASVNTKTGKTVMFSLPRSLQRAPFPEGTGGNEAWPNGYYCPEAGPGAECLINAIWRWAETDGKQYYSKFKNPGLRATMDAVQGVLGLKVDTYVMLNLNGFQDFVDALDGVTVDVRQRLPIGGSSLNKVATGGYIEKGKNQHLDGYHALWFARSRWSTSDYDRMQRQRCVIGAVVDQADPLKVAKNFPDIAAALKKNLATGIDSDDLGAWAELALRVQKGGVTSIVFDPTVINTVNPDIPAIHKLVETAVKSTAKVKKSAPEASASPSPSAGAGTSPTKGGDKATDKATDKSPTKAATPGKAQNLKSVC
jgi:LCP family protein required for cell wall assembly